MRVIAKTQHAGFKLYEGFIKDKNCVLLQTGMGLSRAYAATQAFLKEQRPEYIINIGYAGGLAPNVKNPEIILADQVNLYPNQQKAEVPTQVQKQEQTLSMAPSPKLLEQTRKMLTKESHSFHEGKLLSAEQAVLKSKEKLELHQKYHAIAIDMESYSVLKAANEKNIPAISLRFIVDSQKEELSDTRSFVEENGKVKPFSLIKTTAKNPKILLELPALAMLAQKARQQMEKVVIKLLELSSTGLTNTLDKT